MKTTLAALLLASAAGVGLASPGATPPPTTFPIQDEGEDKGEGEGEGEEPELTPAMKAQVAGKEAFKARKFEEAIKHFSESAKLNPKDFNTVYMLGQSYHSLNRLKQAIEQYNKAIELLPGHHMAYHNRGVAKAAQNEWELALKDFDEAVALDPNYAPGWHTRATAHMVLGNDKEAIADCDRALSKLRKKHSGPAHHTRGIALLRLGRTGDALKAFEQAVERGPGRADWLFRLGVAQSRAGELAKADATITKSIEMKEVKRPLNDYLRARAISTRGQVRSLAGKPKEALADLVAAAKLTPKHVYTPLWIYALGGDKARIEALVKEEYDKDEDRFIQQIMRFYLGTLDEATLWKHVKTADDEKGIKARTCQVHCYQALLLERQGKPKEALPHYRRAVEQGARGYAEHWWANERIKALTK